MALAYKVYETVMNQVDFPFFYKRKFPKVFFLFINTRLIIKYLIRESNKRIEFKIYLIRIN